MMVADPFSVPARDHSLDRQFLDLALSAQNAVRWVIDFVHDECTWTPGMAAVLCLPHAADEDVEAKLRELIRPWTVAIETTEACSDVDLEQPVVTAEGETRFLHFHARPLDGQPDRGLIGLVRDVTGMHRDRCALTDLAERYRLLVELSPDAICVHQDEIIRYANTAMRRILGAESGPELVGRRLTDFVAPDSIPPMRERIRMLTTTGESTPRAEAELQRVDAFPVPVELVSVRTSWDGRRAQQVIGRDITSEKAAEATLRYQAALVQHVNNAIIATDREGVVTSWNPAAESVYGIPADHAVGREVAKLVGAPLQPADLLCSDGDIEVRHRRADGTALVIRMSVAEMESGFVLVCADETARRSAEQRFATVVAALDEGVIVVGPAGTVESVNPAAQRILGVPERELVDSSPALWTLFDESGAALLPDDHPSILTQRTAQPENSRVVRAQRPDGRSVWLAATSRALNPQDQPPYRVVISFTDITESKAATDRLEYEATHDPLTGLANRTLVLRHLGQARERTSSIAVLFIDLDDFKTINDSLGHGMGDDVLRLIGQRLVRSTPVDDLVGRLGGDEFLVVHDRSNDVTLGELSERLLDAVTEPVHIEDRELHVTASIGVVRSRPDDIRASQDLLRDADVAMYWAKAQGGGRFAYFDVQLRERVQRHMILQQDLRRAAQDDQLWIAYQPVVDLRTERTVAVEGLLRWTHPVHGMVSPDEFIPVAEESDLIKPIGAHTLHMATRQLATGLEGDKPNLYLNVNLSPRQLEDPHLPSIVQHAVAEADLSPHDLCLEITENAIMHDPCGAARVLNTLREFGVRLAIDDFGTGYSSLAQLQRLPLDTLKIDRSLITDVCESDELRVIVTSTVAMAHAIGLNVVAEGVETTQHVELLRSIGCDLAQGYYFSKPAPLDQFCSAQTFPVR
jgi:diguanylate cyclase (GGDEF)-like protein/PAS domain S-box-containing protein